MSTVESLMIPMALPSPAQSFFNFHPRVGVAEWMEPPKNHRMVKDKGNYESVKNQHKMSTPGPANATRKSDEVSATSVLLGSEKDGVIGPDGGILGGATDLAVVESAGKINISALSYPVNSIGVFSGRIPIPLSAASMWVDPRRAELSEQFLEQSNLLNKIIKESRVPDSSIKGNLIEDKRKQPSIATSSQLYLHPTLKNDEMFRNHLLLPNFSKQIKAPRRPIGFPSGFVSQQTSIGTNFGKINSAFSSHPFLPHSSQASATRSSMASKLLSNMLQNKSKILRSNFRSGVLQAASNMPTVRLARLSKNQNGIMTLERMLDLFKKTQYNIALKKQLESNINGVSNFA